METSSLRKVMTNKSRRVEMYNDSEYFVVEMYEANGRAYIGGSAARSRGVADDIANKFLNAKG